MNYLKNLGISFIYSIFSLLILIFFMTVLNYFNVIKGSTVFFLVFNLIFSVFLGAFIISKKCSSNGWFEGLKFGFLFLFFVSLLDYFGFNFSFNLKYLVFSVIILITSLFGGMFGINFRKKK